MRGGANNCPLRPRPWVRADWLEQYILDRLFELYGNPKAIERAIEAAIPDREKVAAIQSKIDKASNRLKAIDDHRTRTLDRNSRGLISDDETDAILLKTKQEQDALHAELDKLTASISHVPSAELIQRASMVSVERYGDSLIATDESGELVAGGNDLGTWLDMTSRDREHLIELAFGSPLPDGKPAGVYVWPIKNQKRPIKKVRLAIRGLINAEPTAVTHSASY